MAVNGKTLTGEQLANALNDYFVSVTDSTHDQSVHAFLVLGLGYEKVRFTPIHSCKN